HSFSVSPAPLLRSLPSFPTRRSSDLRNAANGEFWASRAHLSPRKNWLITSDIITVQGTILNTGKDVHDTLTCGKITRKNPGISSRFKPAHPSLKGQSARPPRYR